MLGRRFEETWKEHRAQLGALPPIYFSLGCRWLTWLVAFGIITLGAAPTLNLAHGPLLLGLTLLQLTAVTIGVLRVPQAYPPWASALDIALALAAIFATGGWDSPFYEFGLTSVIAPALSHGLRGATIGSLLFTLGYVWVLTRAGRGVDNFVTADGRLEGALLSCLVNPLMVAYFSALLAEVLSRLREEQARVRVLAAQEERHRLAREMHDGVAQSLFMLTLSLESCAEAARRQPSPKLAEKLEGLVSVSRQALWEVRNAMFDPEPLLEGSVLLSEALKRLLKEFETVSQIPIEVTYQGVETTLPAPQRAGLYRILQESLANACKHSQAGRVRVQLEFSQGQTRLVVEDDGRGFNPPQVERGRGLNNLQSRAQELGGRLTLTSAPGEGTRVVVELPATKE